jgi:hypothetical protein
VPGTGSRDVEGIERVRSLVDDMQLAVDARRPPAPFHEQGVVEKRIVRPDGEDRRRHPAEVGQQRRQLGVDETSSPAANCSMNQRIDSVVSTWGPRPVAIGRWASAPDRRCRTAGWRRGIR